MKTSQRVLCFAACSSALITAQADPIPIKDFAKAPEVAAVSISPDGRYIGLIRPINGIPSLVTLDKNNGYKPFVTLGGDPQGKYRMLKCDWSGSSRLLCFFRSAVPRMGVLSPASSITAVNVDGSEQVYLKQDGFSGSDLFADGVLDTAGPADSVLVRFRDYSDFKKPYPSVLELNTKTGKTKTRDPGREAIGNYFSDGKGNLRFATSGFGLSPSYFAKASEGGSWKTLEKIKSLVKSAGFIRPIAIDSTMNVAYVIAANEGRNALWSVDLADKVDPVVVFSHPSGEVSGPLLGSNGHLFGVIYQTDRPFVYYTDPVAEEVIDTAKKSLPSGQFNFVVDRSADEQLFVIASSNFIDGVMYYLFDRKTGKASGIGMDYPELRIRNQELGRKQIIRLNARDGAEIAAQLTVPAFKRAENLPLVVFKPSDSTNKDVWRTQYLVQFLASRGYLVLEPAARPFFAASKGEGARLSAEDIFNNDSIDAIKWLTDKRMIDDKRVCISGWGMGALSASLGAAKTPGMYRCVVAIAGMSEVENPGFGGFMTGPASSQNSGDQNKLKTDSALKAAKDINVPMLLIHGDQDTSVKVEQSRRMDKALSSADKTHKYIELAGADHEFSRESDRTTLLSELEKFLNENIGTSN